MTGLTHRESGDGPRAIVFLHGVGLDAESWTFQLDHFRHGFRAIAMNLPGYGGVPPIPNAGFADLADAVVSLLDRLGVARADLVGHSFGGMVGLELTVRRPERLSTLAMLGTVAAFGDPQGAWQRAFVARSLGPLERGVPMAALAREAIKVLSGDHPDPEGMRIALASCSAVPPETFACGIRLIARFDRRDALARIAVPTLVIAGERDRNAPAPTMARMAAQIPAAEYVMIKGSGHLANLEQPAAFNAALEQFLRAHLS